MSSVEKETTTAAQGGTAAQQGEIVVFDAREVAERKIAHIRRLIAEGRTVLINKVPIRTIELAKGKKSYYVLINQGQEGEMVFYITEFARRPVEVI
jgi:rhodanese-related sulfurtransferase